MADYKPLSGFFGNLSASQEYKLKEAFLALYIAVGDAPADTKIGIKAPPPDEAPKKSGGMFGLRSAPAAPESYTIEQCVAELKKSVEGADKAKLKRIFRDTVRIDHPDSLVLRFLRARKWDTAKGLVQLGHTVRWRINDWDIDQVLERGEEYYQDVKPDPGFINQYKDGKVTLHGHDKQGRPIVFINVALHDPKAQSEEAMERYTLNVIESARLCLNNQVTTAAVVFDLGGFGLSNMDYHVVKFILTCFEQYYPECLGYLFIHRAPWVFSGVWNIIKGWIDPVVASKISFTKNEKDLLKYIDSSQIPKSLGGTSPFEYKWIPPTKKDSALVHELDKRKELYAERSALFDKFDKATLKWIQTKDSASSKEAYDERNKIAQEMYEQYWHLDPYVRSRTIFDRNGSLGDFKPELRAGGVAQPVL